MKRLVRPMLLCLLLAGLVLGPALALRHQRPAVRRGCSLATLPTTRIVRTESLLWRSEFAGPTDSGAWDLPISGIAIVPPNTCLSACDVGVKRSKSFDGGRRRTGPAVGATDITTGKLRWVGATMPGSSVPAVHTRGLFILGTKDGVVYAVDDQAFATVWQAQVQQPLQDLALAGQRLVAASERMVCGLDRVTGKALWTAATPGPIATALGVDPSGAGEVVCVGIGSETGEDHLLALDPQSGTARWQAALSRPVANRPLAAGGDIYVITRVEYFSPDQMMLHALDAATGNQKWAMKRPVPTDLWPWKSGLSDMAADAHSVYFVEGSAVFAVARADGKLRWQWRTRDVPPNDTSRETQAGTPLVHDGLLFYCTDRGVRALDCATGRQVWEYRGDDQYHRTISPAPVLAGGCLYAVHANTLDVIRIQPPQSPRVAIQPAAAAIRPVAWLAAGVALLVAGSIAMLFGRLRTLGACLAMGLSALTMAAWFRSYTVIDFVGQRQLHSSGTYGRELSRGITSRAGSLVLGSRQVVWDNSIPRNISGDNSAMFWWRSAPLIDPAAPIPDDPPEDLGLMRFAWKWESRPSGTPLGERFQTGLTVPHWLVAAVLALPGLAWMLGLWRDRPRYGRGRCRQCGYDLRASPDPSGPRLARCPECGQETGEG